MPRRDNGRGRLHTLQVQVTDRQHELLLELVESGLYGRSVEDCAERLIGGRLRDLVREKRFVAWPPDNGRG